MPVNTDIHVAKLQILKATAPTTFTGVASDIIDVLLPILQAILSNVQGAVAWPALVSTVIANGSSVEAELTGLIAATPTIFPTSTNDQGIFDAGLDGALFLWNLFHPVPAPAPAPVPAPAPAK